MQNKDQPAEQDEMTGEEWYVASCKEAVAIYNVLSEIEKQLIPDSLIQAVCDYAGLDDPDDQEPAESHIPENMSRMTEVILMLLLFYSGMSSKEETIGMIRRNTKLHERTIIRQILLRKQEIEMQGT